MDCISVPLHKMNLKSDLVSGTVTIGVGRKRSVHVARE